MTKIGGVMRKLKFYQTIAEAIILILIAACFSSCGTSKKTYAAQRQGFMLMDKSEYTVNKGRKVPTKNYKAIKKKSNRKKAYRY
jgi:hypothetical protein